MFALAEWKKDRPNWYLWLNLLSLDAPLVAIVWQEAFSRGLGIRLGIMPRLVTAGSVWLAYAGDRLLDGEAIGAGHLATPRHLFAHRHKTPLTLAWLCAFVVFLWCALFRMNPDLVRSGLLLASAVSAYFVAVHWPGWRFSAAGLKELFVGSLFAIGSVTFVLARGGGLPLSGLPVLTLFALVCILNCCGIGSWEAELDRRQNQVSMALKRPGLQRAYPALAMGVALAGFAGSMLTSVPALRPVYLSVTASAFLLAALDHFSFVFDANELRVAADAVLLTPLLFLPWNWV
jgi:hypothetical protein